MAKAVVNVKVDKALYREFKRISQERGHTMTWYLVGCIREVVAGSRREEEAKKGGEARPKKAGKQAEK